MPHHSGDTIVYISISTALENYSIEAFGTIGKNSITCSYREHKIHVNI